MLELIALTLLLAVLDPVVADADEAPLRFPVDCELGSDCWIIRHVDHDPGPGAVDYRCGRLTADGHDGVDIAVATMSEVRDGVGVVAVAPGRVLGVRDGMADIATGAPGAPDIAGRECGNGLIVEHEDGRRSQYCHLRRGSIAVRQGDSVEAGALLGYVGLSGRTTFPHVEFRLFEGEQRIDPMLDVAQYEATCGDPVAALWPVTVSDSETPIAGIGLSMAVPELEDVYAGSHREAEVPVSAPLLIAWAQVYGVEPDDRLVFKLTAPNGMPLVDQTVPLEQRYARGVFHAGLRRTATAWPAGDYALTVEVRRSGRLTAFASRQLTLR